MFQLLLCVALLWVHSNANQYTNPIALSAPDPWMVTHKGYYHLVATTWSNFVGIRKSKTLDGLKAVNNTEVYRFEGHTLWAPEIHWVDNKWYLFYAACAPGTDENDPICHRNHVAESESDDPMGPYHFKAHLDDPEDEDFELDPSFIVIDGKQYLLGSFITDMQYLYIRPMSNPYTPSGRKHIISAPTLDWEQQGWTVNEGPEPLYHNGRTFIVYSASYCGGPDYKLGLIEFVGTDPLNITHWQKHPTPVFERSDENHVYGPGHNGFFKSLDGTEDWIVYHANERVDDVCGMERSSRAQKFTWGADGLPIFGVPGANGVKLTAPSGE